MRTDFIERRSVEQMESYKMKEVVHTRSTNKALHSAETHEQNKRAISGCHYQHIFFVIDTSGSIGQYDFEIITSVIGSITTLFCRQIKIAVMTFDHEYFVEFCFDKYKNHWCDRYYAGEYIRSIPYIREGQGTETRWTHTAGAAQCVCNFILDPTQCGVNQTCKDVKVVFITDGHANDPKRNICEEIHCLHNDTHVDTLAIGIGNMNELKLECMREDNLMLGIEYNLFTVPTVLELNATFALILDKLNDPQNTDHLCYHPEEIIG